MVPAHDPKPFDEVFTPYRSLADLIERDIGEAKGGKTPASA
jgi:hypothetical protein